MASARGFRSGEVLAEPRSFDVQPALGLGEAGPAPGPRILAGLHRAGAVGAADARIVLVMERVVGDLVQLDVGPDVLPLPFGERVELDQFELRVPFDQLGARARGRLLAADAGDPGFVAFQGSRQRLPLPLGAALVPLAPPELFSQLFRFFLPPDSGLPPGPRPPRTSGPPVPRAPRFP